LEDAPAVGPDGGLDRARARLLDPVIHASVDGQLGLWPEDQVPAFSLDALSVLDPLHADQARRVVRGQVDGEDVADRRLAKETLLRRDTDAGIRGRVEKPERATPEEHRLPGVSPWLEIPDQVAELPAGWIEPGVNEKNGPVPFLSRDELGERHSCSKGTARVTDGVGRSNDVLSRGWLCSSPRTHEHQREDQSGDHLSL